MVAKAHHPMNMISWCREIKHIICKRWDKYFWEKVYLCTNKKNNFQKMESYYKANQTPLVCCLREQNLLQISGHYKLH